MRPLFTIHGGEYLVGSYIEQRFKHVNIWIPSRDIGVDLLVSDRLNVHTLSLQVKFSKDFLVTHMGPQFQKQLRACGWWTLKRDKLRASSADFWVFVLVGFERRTTDFIVVPTKLLWRRLQQIHGSSKIIQSYLWVTEHKQCWETRGLQLTEQRMIADAVFQNPLRDFSQWLNNWDPVAKLDR